MAKIRDTNCPILDICGQHWMDDGGHSVGNTITNFICQFCPRDKVGLPCVLDTGELRPSKYKEVRERYEIVKQKSSLKH